MLASSSPLSLPLSPPTDTITVVVVHEEQIAADRADLFVTITGASLVTGSAAVNKAREVRQLVADLAAVGVTDADVHLQSVVAAQATGSVLGKSSSATYHLKIHCARLDTLADVLGAITAQKNTTLRSLAWGYPDDREARAAWLDACIEQANEKARRIAAGLGVRLLGVHRFSETFADEEAARRGRGGEDLEMAAFARRQVAAPPRVTSEELGLEVSHSKRVELRVEVAYYISRFDQNEPMNGSDSAATSV